ncbi:MAG: GNAT family N-acetyltransferase [Chitinophagaceae bacterium]
MFWIRIADIEDAEILAKLSRLTFYETFASQNSKENMDMHMDMFYSTEKITAELCDSLSIFLLAFEDDNLVGYVKMNEQAKEESKELESPLEIERIYTIKEKIGKGIGKILMEKCFEVAREKGKKSIWLGVWEKNFKAIEFYTRWGFEKFGEHEFPVGLDPQTDWLMKKSLIYPELSIDDFQI